MCVDLVKTSCWSSNWASEWREEGEFQWLLTLWSWLVAPDGLQGLSFSQPAADLLGFSLHYNHLQGLQRILSCWRPQKGNINWLRPRDLQNSVSELHVWPRSGAQMNLPATLLGTWQSQGVPKCGVTILILWFCIIGISQPWTDVPLCCLVTGSI